MKLYFKFLLLITVLISCNATPEAQQTENHITLSGTVGFPQPGLVILEKFDGVQPVPYDTISVDQETYAYSQKVKIDTPGYYRLNFYNKQQVMLILHDDDMQINVDGNSTSGFSEVTGSSDHDFIIEAQSLFQNFQSSPEIQVLNQQFNEAAQAQNKEVIDSLRVEYMELEKSVKDKLIAKIDSAGASLGVVEILKNGRLLDKDKHFTVFQEYAEELEQSDLTAAPVVQEFLKEVEQMKKLSIGQVAPEIALPNPEGEVVKLSSLRGNYVLLDFWAKWCKPCRMENPNVVRMYNKYNDQGFEVYGVSLDRNKKDWLQAIEEDELHWTQVSDLKFWNSEAAQLYNIKAIPFALLLDPDGVIIGRNLRGAELEKKLEEIFSEEG